MYKLLDPYLEPLMATLRGAEEFLGPDDDWVEDDRRILFEAAQRHLGRFHKFVYEKSAEDYVTTAQVDSDVVEEALHAAGYQRNLLSSRKYREHHEGGRQWAEGSWVFDPSDTDWQHHVYLFEAPNGGTDIYAHRETSVREGSEHLTEEQIHGDPNDRLRSALSSSSVPHSDRDL